MANTSIQLKKSGQTGNTPASLAPGEIALNYADGKLYYKNSANVITYINNQDSFSTINVGGNLILASSPTSTLSIQAGNNITLDTDVITNKITISTTGSATDSSARDNAAAASAYANAAFLQANAAFVKANTPDAIANSAATYANGAFTAANSAGSYANAAFIQANAAFDKANTYPGNANQVLYKNSSNTLTSSSGLVYDGVSLKVNGNLETVYQNGDEGGEIFLNKACTNTTLVTGVTIDVYQNKLRIFEAGGTNRGVYIDMANGASGGVGTNLLSPAGGAVTSVAGATGTVSNTQLITGIQTVSSSYGITFDYVATANNGQGTNFKVGDDAWIGDYNVSNAIKIKGQQDAANGYISFGSNSSTLGVAGAGQLTYGGNTVWHAGNDGTGSGLDADLLDGLNSSELAKVSAESYANASFISANAAFAKANAAYNYANTLTTSSIANGTSNVAISTSGGNITAAVAGNTVVTISANGISTSGLGSGDILGANNIYANNFIAANGIVVAGLNVVPHLQSAYNQANTDVTNVVVTAGQYGNTTTVPVLTIAANGRITAISNATITGGGSGAYISSGTSNVYFAGANSSIVANVAGNTIVTITANGIVTSGVSGDISGANNISANSFITTGSGGNISGANNVYANTFIGANAALIAGVNVVPQLTAAFTQANAAFNQANTDVTNVVITAGQYGSNTSVPVLTIAANGRITAVSNATITGGGGSGAYISSGTSNVYFAAANSNIIANVAGNTVVTITANGIVTSGVSGDISGANNISANSFITTGSGGNISGANNVYANTFIAANGVTIAGINVVPYIQSAFTAANTPSHVANSAALYANGAFAQANTDVTNVSITAGQYGSNTVVPVITIAANGRITSVSNATISAGGGSSSYISSGTSNVYFASASGNIVANVSGNTIVTITANGITAGGTGGDISGANTIYANNIITTGTGGTITGANNIYSNTFIAANGVTIAGTNVLPFIQGAFGAANSAGSYANSAYTQANTATTNAATADSKAVSAGSYANSAFAVANTDVTNVSITAGQYGNTTTIPVITIAANGRITAISNATVSGGGGASGSYIYNGTSNVYFTGANGNIVANVSGNTIVTITANGITAGGTGGDISGANTIYANNIITTGTGGTITGANNIYSNTFIAANGIVVAGVNVVTHLQNAYNQANTDVTNVSVTAGQYGSTTIVPVITIAANGRITAVSNATISGGGSGSYIANGTSNVYFSGANIVANVSGNTIVTITANGISTSSSGGSGDISGANNVYANTFVAVTSVSIAGINVIPYITNSFTQANSAFIQANAAYAKANAGGNASYINSGTSNVYFAAANGSIVANVSGNTIVTITANGITTSSSGGSGDITGANNVIANSFVAITSANVAGINVIPFIQSAFGTANASFIAANTPSNIANSAALYANGAFIQANAAFIVANTPDAIANSAALYANGAFTQANAAFAKANTAITTSGGTITGSLNVSANVVIAGNLIVLGTETIVNATTLELDDTLIYLGGNNYTSDVVDIGIIANYNDGANAHTGIFRDANLKEWIFFKGYTPEVQSNNLINIADPSFAYANVWSGYFKGNLIANTVTVSGNTTISGVTNLGPVANVRITGGTNGYVLSTDGAGNLSWVVQSGGGGSGEDQYARDTANAAFTQANAAFAVANTGGGGGGGGSVILATDTFTANGAQNTFTLSYSTATDNIIVNIDGVLQLKSTYLVSGTTLTLDGTPANNAIVEVKTFTGTNLAYYNRTYTGDNTSVSFATTSGVSNVSLIVTENGVVQEPGVDYYISGANVIFTTAPSTGVKIGIRELASTANVTADLSPAFNQANAAFAQANAAFNQANTSSGGVTTGKAIAMAIVFGG